MNKNIRAIILGILIACICGYFALDYIGKKINSGRILASGTIEPIEVQVGSKVSGKVLDVVDEGVILEKGDVVARIDVPELEEQYKAAKAQEISTEIKSINAKSDFDRITKLFKGGMASQQQYETSQTAYETSKSAYIQAKAAAATAKIQLDYGTIVAPSSGTVLVKVTEAGELVSPGSTVVTMADIKHLELKIYVTEQEVGYIDLGDNVSISVDSFPGKKFSGRVKYISSQAEFTPKNIQTKDERVNQVFAVKVDIPNEDLRLKPGMPADAVIDVRNRN